MVVKKKVITAPLTFDLGKSLQKKLELYQAKTGLRFKSEIIRQAVSQYDFNDFETQKQDHAQVSVRLPEDLKSKLIRTAKSKKISVGKLIRAAVDDLLDQPVTTHSSPPKTNTMAVKKSTAKKSVAKKPAAKKAVKKTAAKKVVAKKAPAKKAAVKKAAAKKPATKKAPAKKAAAAKKPAAKKAAAKKPAAKKTAAKK